MSLVYLLTECRYVAPQSISPYIQQILDEDKLLSDALADLGIDSLRVDWSDDSVDWQAADAIVVRTTWDYFNRFKEFDTWLSKTSVHVPFINPVDLLRWNMDKHYLLDLSKRGFHIVPSIFLERGEQRTLSEIQAASGWDDVILKPCVSGSARHTYRIAPHQLEEHQSILAELLKEEAMMLQEFHPSILSAGEVSHMVMNGQYTHSILKQSKGDDFRVQDDFGGTLHEYTASEEEIKLAEAVFESCSPIPTYGRLDVMWNEKGETMIGELEIIEPELWMRMAPESAQEFAKGIAERLS